MENPGMIYGLIGRAMGMIGAIGKDSVNQQQKFKYRGIDAVYNALNPVMAELGLFICPEVLEQRREERQTSTGGLLKYTILTMRYTVYAPDGSNVIVTVVGEGMDSGDKSANKAMSVAMKYAMFQLFFIPTEEMKDPDADVYTDVLPNGAQAAHSAQQRAPQPIAPPPSQATVAPVQTVPQTREPDPNPQEGELPGAFIKRRIAEISQTVPGFNFMNARAALIQNGLVEDVPSATMNMQQARQLMDAIWANVRKAS